MSSQTVTLTDTVGVTDSLSRHLTKLRTISDTVGIVDAFKHGVVMRDTVGIAHTVAAVGTLIQYDTWRPVPRPDNLLILACRTPKGEHDTATGFTHMTLWTFHNDGSNENVVMNVPATNGWTSFGHPEWTPDGSKVVIYVEDSTTFKIVVLDARNYDRPLT